MNRNIQRIDVAEATPFDQKGYLYAQLIGIPEPDFPKSPGGSMAWMTHPQPCSGNPSCSFQAA
jgi:hypothetical protein